MNIGNSKLKLIIIGAGGHARTVIDICFELGIYIEGIIDVNYSGRVEKILGIDIIGGIDQIEKFDPSFSFFVAIGDNQTREKVSSELNLLNKEFVNLIHPTAIISSSAKFGKGVLIAAGSIINPEVNIGEGCIVNTGTIIDHECEIGDYTHLAPSVSIAGRSKIGKKSFIGIGTSIIDNIVIGNEVIIGAGSVIIKSIPNKVKVVGVSKIVEL